MNISPVARGGRHVSGSVRTRCKDVPALCAAGLEEYTMGWTKTDRRQDGGVSLDYVTRGGVAMSQAVCDG